MKILLADDDTGTRDLIKRALETDGHTVIVAADGIGASEQFAGGRADIELLVVDVDMPGLDGLTVAKHALEVAPTLKVIVISAHESQLSQAANLPGANVATLVKPFPLEKIRAAIADLNG
jgi:DNA-binding response OmpR family regulator